MTQAIRPPEVAIAPADPPRDRPSDAVDPRQIFILLLLHFLVFGWLVGLLFSRHGKMSLAQEES